MLPPGYYHPQHGQYGAPNMYYGYPNIPTHQDDGGIVWVGAQQPGVGVPGGYAPPPQAMQPMATAVNAMPNGTTGASSLVPPSHRSRQEFGTVVSGPHGETRVVTSNPDTGAPIAIKPMRSKQTREQRERLVQNKRVYDCPFCGHVFSCSSNLSRHKRVHTGVKPYVHSPCALRFLLASPCECSTIETRARCSSPTHTHTHTHTHTQMCSE